MGTGQLSQQNDPYDLARQKPGAPGVGPGIFQVILIVGRIKIADNDQAFSKFFRIYGLIFLFYLGRIYFKSFCWSQRP